MYEEQHARYVPACSHSLAREPLRRISTSWSSIRSLTSHTHVSLPLNPESRVTSVGRVGPVFATAHALTAAPRARALLPVASACARVKSEPSASACALPSQKIEESKYATENRGKQVCLYRFKHSAPSFKSGAPPPLAAARPLPAHRSTPVTEHALIKSTAAPQVSVLVLLCQ